MAAHPAVGWLIGRRSSTRFGRRVRSSATVESAMESGRRSIRNGRPRGLSSQGVIAALRRVCLMGSCVRGFVGADRRSRRPIDRFDSPACCRSHTSTRSDSVNTATTTSSTRDNFSRRECCVHPQTPRGIGAGCVFCLDRGGSVNDLIRVESVYECRLLPAGHIAARAEPGVGRRVAALRHARLGEPADGCLEDVVVGHGGELAGGNRRNRNEEQHERCNEEKLRGRNTMLRFSVPS